MIGIFFTSLLIVVIAVFIAQWLEETANDPINPNLNNVWLTHIRRANKRGETRFTFTFNGESYCSIYKNNTWSKPFKL